jgi:tetratricopeptide (TPR) repeat protein
VLDYYLNVPTDLPGYFWLAFENESAEADATRRLASLEGVLHEIPGWKLAQKELATLHRRIAWIEYRRGHYSQGAIHCEAAFNLDPTAFSTMDLKLLADLRVRSDSDPGGAIPVLDTILLDTPDDGEALHVRAHARESVGDFAGAIADFKRCQQISPYTTANFVCCANARQRAGDYNGAIADMDRALTDSPDDYKLLRCRAAAKGESDDAQGAIDDLERLLEQKPGDIYGLICLAFRRQQLLGKDAIEPSDLDAMAARDPEDCAYIMGCLRAHQGRTLEALRWLRLSLKNQPANRSWMQRDPDLRPLQNNADFRAFINEFES